MTAVQHGRISSGCDRLIASGHRVFRSVRTKLNKINAARRARQRTIAAACDCGPAWSLFCFDRIETGLWILDLTRFPDANRYPPPDQVRGHASLENALVRVFVILLAARNDVGVRQPTVQVDIPAALGTERARGFDRRLAADRARFCGSLGSTFGRSGIFWWLSWHSATRSESGNLRRRAVKSSHTAAGRRYWCRSRPS